MGTTDEPVERVNAEPRATSSERKFLLNQIAGYFNRAPKSDEILSVCSGLRPLVRRGHVKSSKLSRDHSIMVSQSGLITVTGGKWTTYRRMGQDSIDHASAVASLPRRPLRTLEMKVHGWTLDPSAASCEWELVYGSDLPLLQALSDDDQTLNALIHPQFPFRMREVVWAARYEMARTVEDILARRTRALFLDARAAIEAAPEVSRVLARELKRSNIWAQKDLMSFSELAKGYLYDE